MARQGITEQQVIDAAQALLDQNQNITVTSIRDKLGTGSYSTISPYLAKWKEANDNRQIANIPDMPANVDSAFKSVWALAWKEAQTQIQAERDGLDAVKQEFEREKKDMVSEIVRLEAENDTQSGEIKNIGNRLSEKINALSEAENAINELKIENARLDERSKSFESRAGELKGELGQLHERFKEVSAAQKKTRDTKSRAKTQPKSVDEPAP